MNENFVMVSVLPETREDLRFIAKHKDTNIYKIIRDFVQAEKKKILSKSNACVDRGMRKQA